MLLNLINELESIVVRRRYLIIYCIIYYNIIIQTKIY